MDSDLREMFLNFPLDLGIQLSSGIDLTTYKKYLEVIHLNIKTKGDRLMVVCNRTSMGCIHNIYAELRTYYHAKEFVLGNTQSLDNPFRWDNIILNLPGGNFNPAMARVLKWDVIDECMAIDICIYIDDLRVTVFTRELGWEAT